MIYTIGLWKGKFILESIIKTNKNKNIEIQIRWFSSVLGFLKIISVHFIKTFLNAKNNIAIYIPKPTRPISAPISK